MTETFSHTGRTEGLVCADAVTQRWFLTYRGVSLPLQLTEELPPDGLGHRNTFFRAEYDAQGRMVRCEKRVYGEVEMLHVYHWAPEGHLAQAIVSIGDEDPQVMTWSA